MDKYVVNPVSKRHVKVGGDTYNKLVKNKIIDKEGNDIREKEEKKKKEEKEEIKEEKKEEKKEGKYNVEYDEKNVPFIPLPKSLPVFGNKPQVSLPKKLNKKGNVVKTNKNSNLEYDKNDVPFIPLPSGPLKFERIKK
jgi:hypothetical protein